MPAHLFHTHLSTIFYKRIAARFAKPSHSSFVSRFSVDSLVSFDSNSMDYFVTSLAKSSSHSTRYCDILIPFLLEMERCCVALDLGKFSLWKIPSERLEQFLSPLYREDIDLSNNKIILAFLLEEAFKCSKDLYLMDPLFDFITRIATIILRVELYEKPFPFLGLFGEPPLPYADYILLSNFADQVFCLPKNDGWRVHFPFSNVLPCAANIPIVPKLYDPFIPGLAQLQLEHRNREEERSPELGAEKEDELRLIHGDRGAEGARANVFSMGLREFKSAAAAGTPFGLAADSGGVYWGGTLSGQALQAMKRLNPEI